MTLQPAVFANALVLSVSGRLDQMTCETFRSALGPHLANALAAGQGIVLDLAQLDYVSSAGLRCFMLAAKEAKARAGKIVVADLQPMVAEIFQISRFDLVLPVHAHVIDALQAISNEAASAYLSRQGA
ncbi:MAG: STAS domain-containing protein [Betaproteobacteria bacterium]|nr:STAS domain-containing protein [Betaproteobacteria bacterium]